LVPTALLDFRPSTPVPTTVQIPLPDARKTSVLFDFHPSAKQTAVRVVGGNSTTKVVACASYNQYLWMHHLNGDAAYLPV
jgi:hypothetical protein